MSNNESTGTPDAMDIAIGSRIRLRRKELGISQSALAGRVGVTFQQIQKYEIGSNRVSFSRLVEIAHAMKCTSHDLIGDLDGSHNPLAGNTLFGDFAALLNVPGAVDLLKAFSRITNGKQRRAVANLARQLSEGEFQPENIAA